MSKAAEVTRTTAGPEQPVVGVEGEGATVISAPTITTVGPTISIQSVEAPALPVERPVAVEEIIPPYVSAFPTVLTYDVSPRDHFISVRRGRIAQFKQQRTQFELILEWERLIAAVKAKYGHPVVVEREQTERTVKRTADAALGVSLVTAMRSANRNAQHAVLFNLYETLADDDLPDREGEVSRMAALIVDPAERELIEWYQAYFDRAYFADMNIMMQYASALITDDVDVVPPQITKPWFWRSPKPYNRVIACAIADLNQQMWPSMTKTVYGYIANTMPRLSVEPGALSQMTVMLGANILSPNAMSGLFDPAGISGLGGATSESATTFVRGWFLDCVSAGHSYLTMPVNATNPSPANILTGLLCFLFPTYLWPVHIVNALRNAVASQMYPMAGIDRTLAANGAIDYTVGAGALPPELVAFMHFRWPRNYQAIDGRRDAYDGNGSNIAFFYPLGIRVEAGDLNHPMLNLFEGLLAKLRQNGTAPLMKMQHKTELLTMMNAARGALSSIMQLAYSMQNLMSKMPPLMGARCEANMQAQEYANIDHALPIPISMTGPLSTMMATVPMMHTSLIVNGPEQFRHTLVVSRSAHMLCDAWDIMKKITAGRAFFVSEKLRITEAIYDSMGSRNWFIDLFFTLAKTDSMNSSLRLPSANGVWIEEHERLMQFVLDHPEYFGYAQDAYEWHDSLPVQDVGRLSAIYEAPTYAPGFISQKQQRMAVRDVRAFDDLRLTLRKDPIRYEGPFAVESRLLRNDEPVPTQSFVSVFSKSVVVADGGASEIPLVSDGPIYWMYRSSVDDDGLVPVGVPSSDPPTLLVRPVGDVEPNTDAAAYIANCATKVKVTKAGVRLLDLGQFRFYFTRPF